MLSIWFSKEDCRENETDQLNILSTIILLGSVLFGLTPIDNISFTRDGALIAQNAPIQVQTYIEPQEQVKAQIRAYSHEYGISSEIPLAIAEAESNFDPNAKNPDSTVKGVFQFLDGTFKEQCENETNISCGVKLIAQKEYWRWEQSMDKWLPMLSEETQKEVNQNLILHSCIKYVRTKIPLPPMRTPADVSPNIPECTNCAVLFKYPNGYHIALSEYLFPGGVYVSETNWRTGQYTERFVFWTDPALRGFYKYVPLTKR